MAGMNRAIICGRLGRDPEVRNLQSGGKVVSFSLATSESWMKDGERQEQTEWHNIVVFNEKQGEVAEKYLRKGGEVLLEGKLQTRKWTDKEGRERYTTEIVLPKFGGALTLIGGRQDGGGSSSSSSGSARQTRESAGAGAGGTGQDGRGAHIDDDDIPW